MESVTNAAALQDQFLNLLVTQLRHQDPLEPTKQEDFLGQLAQFATVEGLETLNSNFTEFTETQATGNDQDATLASRLQNAAAATNLIDRDIEFTSEDGEVATGTVNAVVIENDQVLVRVDETLVALDQIRSISNAAT